MTDDDQVSALNASYRADAGGLDARGRPKTTDVLSFPLADEVHPQIFGDVVISVEQAARQSPADDLEGELVRLLVHGLCHLRGHDHHAAAERRRMLAEERRLLGPLGLETLIERADD